MPMKKGGSANELGGDLLFYAKIRGLVNRNADSLPRVNKFWIGNLWICSNQSFESNIEALGNGIHAISPLDYVILCTVGIGIWIHHWNANAVTRIDNARILNLWICSN